MLKYWCFLAFRTIGDPRGVLSELRQRQDRLSDLAQAAALVSALGVILYELSLLVAPVEAETGDILGISMPLEAFLFQYTVILLMSAAIWLGGRMFRGQASLADSLLAIIWLQFVMMLVQVAQVAVLLLIPPLSVLVFLAAIALMFYLLVNFIMEIHGFNSAMAVVAGVIGGFFALALVMSLLLALFGIGLDGVAGHV